MSIYVTSRSRLPDAAEDMDYLWFNVWQTRLWPYRELQPGDDLWWYESSSGRLRWHSRVARVEAFPYSGLDDALDRLDELFGTTVERRQDYLHGKPDEGYCLGYTVEALKLVDVPRPDGVTFSRTGWERGDRDGIAEWLRSAC